MKLMTKEIERKLPALTEDADLDKVAVLKFFDPCGRYTLYVVEGQEEGTFLHK